MSPARMPGIVLAYGLLGLIPFLALPLFAALFPGRGDLAGTILALYAALILSFLGGARWGLTIGRPAPDARVVSLAMLPTLVGLALLLTPNAVRLPGLAVALVVHWLWDIRSAGLPPWYPALRSILSAGAVAGLIAGTVILV